MVQQWLERESPQTTPRTNLPRRSEYFLVSGPLSSGFFQEKALRADEIRNHIFGHINLDSFAFALASCQNNTIQMLLPLRNLDKEF